MKVIQEVFQRFEKKYLLTETQYQLLRNCLEDRMEMDQYGQHTICNLYLDTPSYQLIRTSLEKPPYKEKIRLRSYGVPKKEDTVFLELKKKFKGEVYKRRMPLSLEEAVLYLQDGAPPEKTGQIFQEIDWFMKRYQPYPRVFLAYNRVALFHPEAPELRVTFDSRVRYRTDSLDLSKGDWGSLIMKPGMVLMEIKIPGAMPVWMAHILAELEIVPASFSKYGTCYEQYLHREQGGIICA